MALEGDESLNELVNSYIEREADLEAQIQDQSEHLSAQRETIAAQEEALLSAEEQFRPAPQTRTGIGTIARLAAAAQPHASQDSEIVAREGAALAASQISDFDQYRSGVV